MRCAALITFVGIGAVTPVGRADDPPKPQAKPAGPAVEVKMADGSAVRMTLTQDDRGHDQVRQAGDPADEVRRVEFGFRYPDGAEAKVTELVAQLGDGNYKRRETAMTELLAFRELAYPALKRATRSGDAETAKRAAELVAKLEDKLPPEKLKFRDYDLVMATDFTARGRIESKSLSGHTPYFGEVRLQVAEVRALRSVAIRRGDDRSGGRRQVPRPGPHGLARHRHRTGRRHADRGGRVRDDPPVPRKRERGHAEGPPELRDGDPPGRALLGKVGESGEVFLIGEKYTGTPKGSGKLYLAGLAPSPWPNQAQGTFKVTITPNPIK